MATESGNPWFSIWLRPRATISNIIDIDATPTWQLLLMAAAGGVARALTDAFQDESGNDLPLPELLGATVVGGAVVGVLLLYLFTALLKYTGRWLDGAASTDQLRSAYAWSSVPLIWGLLLWVPLGVLLGDHLFRSNDELLQSLSVVSVIILVLIAVKGITDIWGAFTLIKCIAEVQAFSAWKALGNILLAALVLLVPVLLVVAVIAAVSGRV